MEFSQSMLMDFAKTVKQDQRAGDVTLMGNVVNVIDSETAAVRIDGATSDTLAYIATGVDVGNRVGVLIKNHKAIITSNLSSTASPGTVTNYNNLTNKPSIEGVTLEGNKTFEELNLENITNSELESMLTL